MATYNVLIVDDEHDFLDMTVKRLQKRGLVCKGVDNGIDAVKTVKAGDIDVVLLDVKMPGIDGIETLKQIKALKPLTEVVMLTGHASVQSGIDGMKLGAFDYLMKPTDFDELIEKLNDAYEKKKIQTEKIEQAQFVRNLSAHRG
jgi:DNA-binding NtrC family response regulator